MTSTGISSLDRLLGGEEGYPDRSKILIALLITGLLGEGYALYKGARALVPLDKLSLEVEII